MTLFKRPVHSFFRRLLILVSCIFLSACVGGSGENVRDDDSNVGIGIAAVGLVAAGVALYRRNGVGGTGSRIPDIAKDGIGGTGFRLRADLQSIDVAKQTIKILGQTARINAASSLSGSLESLAIGDSVSIQTRKDSDGQLTVNTLNKIKKLNDIFIQGKPEAANSTQTTLTLFRQIIYTSSTTNYINANQSSLSQSEFFSGIKSLQTEVRVTGKIRSNGTIDATRLQLLN